MDPVTLGIVALGYLAKTAREDYKDIRKLIYSSEYQNLNTSDRNKRLGKELAGSLAFTLSLGSIDGILPGSALYNQYRWRTTGTSDWLREFIEKYI